MDTLTLRCYRDKRSMRKRRHECQARMRFGGDYQDEMDCAYLLEEGDVRQICSAALRSGRPFPIVPSIMCCGSAVEAGHLREVEALAKPSAATAAQQTAGLPDNS
jgi:hypothetical protein